MRADKRLGQHFLKDIEVLDEIDHELGAGLHGRVAAIWRGDAESGQIEGYDVVVLREAGSSSYPVEGAAFEAVDENEWCAGSAVVDDVHWRTEVDDG